MPLRALGLTNLNGRKEFVNARCLSILIFAILLPRFASAQKEELGLTLGSFISSDRTSTAGIPLGVESGVTLQANYGYRVLQAGPTALYVGLNFLASPQRQITSSNMRVTRDIASLYLTPDVMLKFVPHGRVNPWGTIGGGYGDYEQSTTTLSGGRNGAPRELTRGVLMFGGGVDVHVWRLVSLRGEVRDFYTGNAAYNLPLGNSQHNVTVGGGLVLHFGGR